MKIYLVLCCYRNYGPAPDGKAVFGVELAMKDARHALKYTNDAGTRFEDLEVALAHMETASKLAASIGRRPMDSASMYGALRQDAGLDSFTCL